MDNPYQILTVLLMVFYGLPFNLVVKVFGYSPWNRYIVIGGYVVLIGLFAYFVRRSRRKRMDQTDTL